MHFASGQAMNIGVSDLELFYLGKAIEKRNARYLYKLIANYDVRQDPGNRFMKTLLAHLQELSAQEANRLPIADGEELLSWYEFQFKTKAADMEEQPEDRCLIPAEIDAMFGARL